MLLLEAEVSELTNPNIETRKGIAVCRMANFDQFASNASILPSVANSTVAPAIHLPAWEVLPQNPNLALCVLAKLKLNVPVARGCHNVVMLESILAPLVLVNPRTLDQVFFFFNVFWDLSVRRCRD